MKAFPNKRKNPTRTQDELFKIKNLKSLLKKEQRAVEIAKIKEVASQDRTYFYTLGSCILMILILISFALFGGYNA